MKNNGRVWLGLFINSWQANDFASQQEDFVIKKNPAIQCTTEKAMAYRHSVKYLVNFGSVRLGGEDVNLVNLMYTCGLFE